MNKPSITVATPHQADFRDAVNDQFYKEIETSQLWSMGSYLKIEGGSCISSLRWNMAKTFLKGEDDYLLFIDSDMLIIETGSIDKLIETSRHYHDGAIVSALFGKKTAPYNPTYAPLLNMDKNIIKAKNLLEKESTGMAFTLIPRFVVEQVFKVCMEYNDKQYHLTKNDKRYEQPFQPFVYKNKYTGEDRAFCIRAGFCGIKTIIDTRVIIGHIGDCVFTPAPWVEEKTVCKK